MTTTSSSPQDSDVKILPRASDAKQGSVDITDVISVLWRGKILIILSVIIAILVGGYYAYVAAVPLYRSTAVVILQTKQQSIVDLQSVVGGINGDNSEVKSEVEVLRARSLMGKVVDRLDLTNDPEFNIRLQPPSLIDETKEQVKSLLGLSRAPTVPEVDRVRDSTTLELLKHVQVRNIPQSLVFEITAETTNAKKSALLADTIVELYILNQLDVKFQATEQAKSWLSNRVVELQDQLEVSEMAVADFSSSTNLVSADALQALDRQLKDIRDRMTDTNRALDQAQTNLMTLKAAGNPAAKAEAAQDAQLNTLLAGIATDPEVTRAFDARFEQIIARADLEVMRQANQFTALKTSEAALQDQIDVQSGELIELQQLTREAEASRLLYEYFLTRLKETSAQQGIQQADSRVLSNAVVPNWAAAPRKGFILVVSALLGFIIGAGIVFLLELRKSGFRDAPDLERTTGYTVLGQIPSISARNRRNTLKYLSERPTSAAAEAIRNLRTSIMLSNVDEPPQIIISTSSIPGEGKTTNSLALTQNMGRMGRKVLLMEGDIRRRTFSQYFDDLPTKGLVSVLDGKATIDEAIYHNKTLQADMLVGEKTDTNAADLFSSVKFAELLKTLRGRYDTIIIDTPPVLIVPDARIIAQNVDAVLFTVKWNSTAREQVEEGLSMFRTGRIRIGGLVLSQIDSKQMKRYGGKYGNYSAYGSKYYTN